MQLSPVIEKFSIGFAIGVVSGLVMSYQFGTNWSQYADNAGPVIGPVLAYEVLTAFFLEAGFVGVMPPDITIWQAAAARASQVFVLVCASVLIPVIPVYTGFSYWVFRRKVQAGAHYH